MIGWPAALLALPGVTVVATLWWLRRRYLVVTVRGRSMTPTLDHGDRVLVRRTQPHQVRAGDIVVVKRAVSLLHTGPPRAGTAGRVSTAELPAPPSEPVRVRWRKEPAPDRVVKRVAAAPGDPVPPGIDVPDLHTPAGQLVLLGDNPIESTDSRVYGYVPADQIIGTVLRHLR